MVFLGWSLFAMRRLLFAFLASLLPVAALAAGWPAVNTPLDTAISTAGVAKNDLSNLTSGALLPKASGGTGGTTGLSAAQNLSHAYVLCSDATQHPMGANTAQTILATCTIPANALSAGAVVRIGQLWSFTGNTDTKSFQFWLNSSPIVSGGAQMFGTSTTASSNTTLSANQTLFAVRDASTEINNNSFWGGFSAQTVSIVHYSTTSTLYIIITGTQTATADNLALEHYVIEILPPGGN